MLLFFILCSIVTAMQATGYEALLNNIAAYQQNEPTRIKKLHDHDERQLLIQIFDPTKPCDLSTLMHNYTIAHGLVITQNQFPHTQDRMKNYHYGLATTKETFKQRMVNKFYNNDIKSFDDAFNEHVKNALRVAKPHTNFENTDLVIPVTDPEKDPNRAKKQGHVFIDIQPAEPAPTNWGILWGWLGK